MFRYLPGIVLVQVVTLTLFWVNRDASVEHLLLRVVLPAIIVSGVTALWLSLIGRMDAEQRNSALKEKHAAERTRLNREIERARADVMQKASVDRTQLLEQTHAERERLVKKTHKQLMAQERSASRRSNAKVGLAFAAMTVCGVVFMVTELLTLGLITMTTAAGAMGGYLVRWQQSNKIIARMAREQQEADGKVALTLPDSDSASALATKKPRGRLPISVDASQPHGKPNRHPEK